MQHLILQHYLNSEIYKKSEYDKVYINLIQVLSEQLTKDTFLKCEEMLNEVIMRRIENVFLYVCTETICPYLTTKTSKN